MIFSKTWWKAAGIRALRTVAQAALGALGGTALISDVNWGVVAATAAMAGVYSLLTSLAGLPELDKEDK